MHSFCFRWGTPKCDARRRDDGGEKSSDADSEVEDLNISSVSNTCEFKERSKNLTEYRNVCLLWFEILEIKNVLEWVLVYNFGCFVFPSEYLT